MSPALTATLTLIGVIAAGLPLLWLTAPPPVIEHAAGDHEKIRENVSTHATLHFNAAPTQLTLWREGREIADFSSPISPLVLPLMLPADDGAAEIEIRIIWNDDSSGQNGATLILEPDGRERRSNTVWTEGNELHDVFYFQW